MSRQVYALGALLVLSLGLSYLSWTDDSAPVPEGMTDVVPVKAGKLTALRFDDGTRAVDLRAHRDTLGRFFRVTVREAAEASLPDKTFTAGPPADRLVERLAPLRAHRVLDGVEPERLKAMGLDEPEATLELARGERTWTFEVGARTFDGARQYLRERGASKVYMVDAAPLRSLAQAPRELPMRELVGLGPSELRGAEIRLPGEAPLSLTRGGGEGRGHWTARADPTRTLELQGNWLDKVRRLRIGDFVQEGEGPADLDELVSVRFEGEGSAVQVELFRAPAAEGEEPAYFARSGHTRGLVHLPRAQAAEVAADLGSLVP